MLESVSDLAPRGDRATRSAMPTVQAQKRCRPLLFASFQLTTTPPCGTESDPYLTAFVANSFKASPMVWAASGVSSISGPLIAIRAPSCAPKVVSCERTNSWIFTHDTSLLATKLNNFIRLSDRELQCLAELRTARLFVERGRELVRQGEVSQVAYVLQAGWGCSLKLLKDGGRQIITFPIPGDVVGLRSILVRHL
jgi:hypothetical protein